LAKQNGLLFVMGSKFNMLGESISCNFKLARLQQTAP